MAVWAHTLSSSLGIKNDTHKGTIAMLKENDFYCILAHWLISTNLHQVWFHSMETHSWATYPFGLNNHHLGRNCAELPRSTQAATLNPESEMCWHNPDFNKQALENHAVWIEMNQSCDCSQSCITSYTCMHSILRAVDGLKTLIVNTFLLVFLL